MKGIEKYAIISGAHWKPEPVSQIDYMKHCLLRKQLYQDNKETLLKGRRLVIPRFKDELCFTETEHKSKNKLQGHMGVTN